MIYTVKDIEEPDFGCEGLMDGQQVIDKGIDVGDKVIIQDNLLVKAGQE